MERPTGMMPAIRRLTALALTVLFSATFAASAFAAGPTYQFTLEPHSTFFSTESHLSAVVDPQVFVVDAAAPAATGPQGIVHIAGYRPAAPGKDAVTTPLYTAQGKPLGVTLGPWLGATGSGTVTCNGSSAVVSAQLRGLIPHGLYQMTRLQFSPAGVKRTALGQADGAGSTFTASATGSETFTAQLPFCPAATEGVVVAFISDGAPHGAALGDIGINLHNQLAAHLVAAPVTPQALPQSGGGGLARLPEDLLLAGMVVLAVGAAAVRSHGRRVR